MEQTVEQKLKKLTSREKLIYNFIRFREKSSTQEITKEVAEQMEAVTRQTVIRDINALLELGLIEKRGAGGQDIWYEEKIKNIAHKSFNVAEYFEILADDRELLSDTFNSDVFDLMVDIFLPYELAKMNSLNDDFQRRLATYSKAEARKEYERITIEFAWKSAQIEGNTYSLIDTEVLIKQNEEAEGHSAKEAIEILNHKKALDYAREKLSDFKIITLQKLTGIHELLVNDLEIDRGIRRRPVAITATKYRPLPSEILLKAELEKLIELINKTDEPFSKAFIALILISYLQPFQDGNKRTARLFANAILLAHNIAPLSYRSVEASQYKKTMIIFYEKNSFRPFKELFMGQFKHSTENYFI